jgi:hypothetical protein
MKLDTALLRCLKSKNRFFDSSSSYSGIGKPSGGTGYVTPSLRFYWFGNSQKRYGTGFKPVPALHHTSNPVSAKQEANA